MSKVQIFWDPKGLELDTLGNKKYLRATDGDTPYISLSIRMLSIDTPEVHYPGNQKPSRYDDRLKELAQWIKQGKTPANKSLGESLYPKLATGKAGTLQETQGQNATDAFNKMLEDKLTRVSSSGRKSKRRVFVYVADSHFDQYGRVLAYMAPAYSSQERETMTLRERATFNLMMVESGWAAPFPIYPSLPKHLDLVMLQEAGKNAYEHKKGIWTDPATLTGYEYRMCVRLYEVTKKLVAGKKLNSKEKYGWISRFCFDMTTREIYYPQYYYRVLPYNRVFIWPDEVTDAVGKLNLVPSQ
ncbi:thermonuclease family protein [candidate division WOR-3 bacterium]|nr:thermonuclease family protein [candidate division WOR-3 bacterium]